MANQLSVYEPGDAALLGSRDAAEMTYHLAEVQAQMGVVQQFFKQVLVEGQDYGVIPGTDKPALLKPGAEKLCELYGFAPIVKEVDEDRDVASGFFRARVTIALTSKRTGEVVAEGIGEANTHESRYRYRWLYDDKLPAGVDKSVLKKRSGNKRSGGTWTQYLTENDDPWSQWNTILKMAKKRALVDAALSATRSSGLFTQDADAFEKWVDEGAPETTREPVRQPQRKGRATLAAEADAIQGNGTTPAQRPASARKATAAVDDSAEQPGLSGEMQPAWMEEWKTARAAAGLVAADKVHLAAVIGCAPGEVMASIGPWLAAEPGRSVKGLVSGAVDRKLAAAEVEP